MVWKVYVAWGRVKQEKERNVVAGKELKLTPTHLYIMNTSNQQTCDDWEQSIQNPHADVTQQNRLAGFLVRMHK